MLPHRLCRTLLFTIAISSVCARPAAAQYRIDAFTTEQGLPQNSVNSVLQTRDGFLWLTTFAGVARYDGFTFQVFNTINTPELPTSRFGELFEDRDGGLWINTDGFGVVRYRDGVFRTYSVDDGLPDNRVQSVFTNAAGEVLVDTRAGVKVWRGDRFQPYPVKVPSIADADKRILHHAAKGAVWFGDATGVHKFDDGRVTQSIPIQVPKRVFEDRSGRLWIETNERRLQCLVDGKLITYDVSHLVPRIATLNFSDDDDGNVWFGLRGSGTGLLRFRNGAFTHYSVRDGLPSDHVGNIYQDREGTFWAPTDGGLGRLTDRYITSYSVADGLAVNNTYPVFQDRRGDIWIGGWSGLTRYRDGVFTDMAAAMGVKGHNVHSILEDRDGAMWFGTFGDSIKRVKDGVVREFPSKSARGATIRALYQDRAGTIWVGGEAGVGTVRHDEVVWLADYQGGEAFVFAEDQDGAIWIGTERGVTRFSGGHFTNIGKDQGLTGAPVRAIHQDRAGSFWFGTYDTGLFRYRDGTIVRYTTMQGLPTNGAFRIIEDERGSFWISSNVGIYRVSRHDLDRLASAPGGTVTSVIYGPRDGMLSGECNGGGQPAGILARDGRIWFPTQKGVVVFDPASIAMSTVAPPVAITRVLVANQPVPLSDLVEIRSGPTALEVQYAALTFVRPESTRFRFRMEGLNDAWTEAGAERSARFAQLPYGNFRFRVIAANRDGVWNTDGMAFDVRVVPPFWRRPWFLSLMIVAAAVAGVGAHRWRIGLLEQQQVLRQQFSRQLIDSQESERKRIAASLHDSLSQSLIVMKNWAVMGSKKLPGDHQAQQTFAEISDAASSALAEVREISYNLGPYQLERLGLSETIKEMVNKVAAAAAIRFDTSIEHCDGRLSKEAEIAVFRILQEAANNIVKHSGASEASLSMTVEGPRMRVLVRDNGCGFTPGGHSTMGGVPRRQGFGLFGMSERMKMIGGSFSVESAPGRGTRIRLELPVTEQAS
jgi:signal transduction histidine kinase/ligand-binding sensor domain-containing protein